MSTLLTWSNFNANASGIRVYRDTTPIDATAPPAVLTTLAGDALQYEDTTTEWGTTYYYRFETFDTDNSVWSRNHRVVATSYTGAGPQLLELGDTEVGLYGEIPQHEFFGAQELCDLVGFQDGTLMTTTPKWFKFSHGGRILILPHRSIRYSVSWSQLYHAGLVYGNNDTGEHLGSLTPTVQDQQVTLRGDTYRVRLARTVHPYPTAPFVTGDVATTPRYGSELDDLLWGLARDVSPYQRQANFRDFIVSSTDASVSLIGTGGSIVTQERTLVDTDAVDAIIINRDGLTVTSISSFSSGNGWLPVLEFINPVTLTLD